VYREQASNNSPVLGIGLSVADPRQPIHACVIIRAYLRAFMGYWDDYIAARPMTPGGEQRILERQAFDSGFPTATTEPDIPNLPELPKTKPTRPRAPRIKRPLTKSDLVIGAVVFLFVWALLAASKVEVGAAAVFAVFAGAIASMWWRGLAVIAVVGVVIFILANMK
jgi:hypothetical protein